MILGANGLCGKSLLSIFERLYTIKDLILIDPSGESKPPIIIAKPEEKDLWHVMSSMQMKKGDVLIDLAPDLPKIDVMQSADSLGVSVINATCCEEKRGTLTIIDLLDKKLLLGRYDWQVPQMPDAGMNPGTINAMLGAMVEYFGQPLDVTEWEMDSTIPYKWDGEGFATWSPKEFASEYCDESTWEADGKTVVYANGAPIDNLRPMPDGGNGALCQHEEVVRWGWLYGCKARYIYGYAPEAMTAIRNSISLGLELPLCRKLEGRTPTGGDTIGLAVKFQSGERNSTISVSNEDESVPVGSNATSYLVACGVATAFQMLLEETKPGLHWPDEYGSKWVDFINENKLAKIEFK